MTYEEIRSIVTSVSLMGTAEKCKGQKRMGQVLSVMESILEWILDNLYIINVVFAIAIVFFQRKSPKEVWAWLLLMYFIPIVGFLLYMVVHQDMYKRHMFQIKEIEDKLNASIRKLEKRIQKDKKMLLPDDMKQYNNLVLYNLDTTGSVYSNDNSVEIYTDGVEKFQRLLDEIDKAESFIHIEYYIIKKDELFQKIKEHLVEKVRQGVEVRILYDSMGCRNMMKKDWRELNGYGIKTGDFFPASLKWLHVRLNYRNHRKIVVIDNKVGFVGGFNVGREYISLDKKFGYWRDTHFVLYGTSVADLEMRFALDWNYATKENLFLDGQKYFARWEETCSGHKGMQIITSGPDSKYPQIRDTYLSMMHKATKNIYIQTPYFVPDEPILAALKFAARAGIDVRLMIPCKPDHPFVYWATYSYMGELLEAGAKCYTYENGFLHAKGITVDGMVTCYGTANMDIRSFALNFEVNAVVYDRETAMEMEEIFRRDMEHSKEVTWNDYSHRNLSIRLKEQISRLFSPVM